MVVIAEIKNCGGAEGVVGDDETVNVYFLICRFTVNIIRVGGRAGDGGWEHAA